MFSSSISVVINSSDLPVGAGLGSSAAFCVASSGALLKLRETLYDTPAPDASTVNLWAFAGEKALHTTPSGLDNTVSCYGGALQFQRLNQTLERGRKVRFEPIEKIPKVRIVSVSLHHLSHC